MTRVEKFLRTSIGQFAALGIAGLLASIIFREAAGGTDGEAVIAALITAAWLDLKVFK